MKKVLISGISGQDGSYLAELLLSKGYEVHGLILPDDPCVHLASIRERLVLHKDSLLEAETWNVLLERHHFDEVYHFAAQSHVGASFDSEVMTMDLNLRPLYYLLTAVRAKSPETRVFFPASSEVFAKEQGKIYNENDEIAPANPYGISKATGLELCRFYRQAYGLRVSTGILFNHESPRRGPNFVTMKICMGFKRMREDENFVLELGNMDATRDWGYAPEYVEAMWRMLGQEEGDDYILATGTLHSIREWAETAANCAGFQLQWDGTGVNEKGRDEKNGRLLIRVNPEYFRPGPDVGVTGNAGKAEKKLGWKAKMRMKDIVSEMMA